MKKKIAIVILAILSAIAIGGCTRNSEKESRSETERQSTASKDSSESSRKNTESESKADTKGQNSAASEAVLDESRATAIALEHAGRKEADVTNLQVQKQQDDGRQIFEVDFYYGKQKFEYKIDAKTGEILAYEIDDNEQNLAATPDLKQEYITLEEAQAIALEKAGLSASEVSFTKTEFDRDNTIPQYELDFTANGIEYEAEIHAENGSILQYSSEPIGD